MDNEYAKFIIQSRLNNLIPNFNFEDVLQYFETIM